MTYLIISQSVTILVLRWIWKVYWSQPCWNQAPLFRYPLPRVVVVYGTLGNYYLNMVFAFLWTDHPWLFCIASLVLAAIFAVSSGQLGSGR
jgi:hypothetical protein